MTKMREDGDLEYSDGKRMEKRQKKKNEVFVLALKHITCSWVEYRKISMRKKSRGFPHFLLEQQWMAVLAYE